MRKLELNKRLIKLLVGLSLLCIDLTLYRLPFLFILFIVWILFWTVVDKIINHMGIDKDKAKFRISCFMLAAAQIFCFYEIAKLLAFRTEHMGAAMSIALATIILMGLIGISIPLQIFFVICSFRKRCWVSFLTMLAFCLGCLYFFITCAQSLDILRMP